jgi:cell division protein FtsB
MYGRRLFYYLPVVGLLFIWLHFLGGIFFGSSSLMRVVELRRSAAMMSATLRQLSAERLQLEEKISKLSPANLDPDFLDELARVTLGYASPDENEMRIRSDCYS